VTIEGLHPVDDDIYIVSAIRVIHLIYIYRIDGVEFQDIVINLHERIVDCLTMNHRGIAEHADLRFWAILVAQSDGVADNLCEMRMTGRLAIAGEGEYVGHAPFGPHLNEPFLEGFGNGLTSGKGESGAVVFIEAALTIDAVERTDFSVGRQKIDAEGEPQPSAMDRPENR
jgi:hypothetical protein